MKTKLRIFAAVANFNWENPNLIAGLRQCGHEVIQFDWIKLGYDQYDRYWDYYKKREMNELMLHTLKEKHAKEPIQLFFGYLSDPVTYPKVITEIKNMGIYTLNFGCNNQQSFKRANFNVAPKFDCTLYVEKNCGYKFEEIKANALHMPMAMNPDHYKVITSPKYYDASFIGQPYGYRASMMAQFLSYKISYVMAGGGVSYDTMCKIIAETKVNCGFRGLNSAPFNDKSAKQIRLRDFEITACGGFYFAEYLPELEDYYDLDKEVVTFRTHDDFYDLADYYRNADKEREQIAQAGHKRVLQDHTWEKRFNKVFKELGIV